MLLLLILMAAILLLSSCGTVEIKDLTLYGSLGQNGAAVVHTISNAPPTQISNAQWQAKWDDLSNPMFGISASDFAELKKEEEQLCSYSGNCTQAAQVRIRNFFQRIESHIDRVRP